MTDPQTLLTQAQCYLCLGITLGEALQLALLSDILSAGGGGTATTQVLSTVAANPNTAEIVPADPTKAALFYQDPAVGTGTNTWNWSVTNQAWVQLSI